MNFWENNDYFVKFVNEIGNKLKEEDATIYEIWKINNMDSFILSSIGTLFVFYRPLSFVKQVLDVYMAGKNFKLTKFLLEIIVY